MRGIEPPTRQANSYAKDLESIAIESERLFDQLVMHRVLQHPSVRLDAIQNPGIRHAVKKWIRAVKELWAGSATLRASARHARRMITWADHNTARALNIPLQDLPRITIGTIWANRQAELGLGVAAEYEQRVNDVLDDATVGVRAQEIRKKLSEKIGFGRSRARLIARNETLSLAAEVNKTRQESVGVTKYMWDTSDDERVRDTHARVNGQIFEWRGSGAPGVGHPGEEINCRCVAVPILD